MHIGLAVKATTLVERLSIRVEIETFKEVVIFPV